MDSNCSNSFLLLSNGEILTLEEISNSPDINFGGVELITLSACNTGFPNNLNGKEIDSPASVIQTKSGKAVLTTLWSVADEGTSFLMREFYHLRKENSTLTKAEALQQSQMVMIGGRFKPSDTHSGCRSYRVYLDGSKQPDFKCEVNAPFSHAYYWSPFILIGNWQ